MERVSEPARIRGPAAPPGPRAPRRTGVHLAHVGRRRLADSRGSERRPGSGLRGDPTLEVILDPPSGGECLERDDLWVPEQGLLFGAALEERAVHAEEQAAVRPGLQF